MRLIGREIKKTLLVTLLASLFILSSCKNEEVIDYGIEIVETEAVKEQNFSFEKKNVDVKSKVQTKKEKDYIFSQEIKRVIERRTRPEMKVKGIYVPAYVAGDEKRFMPILENIKNSCINTIVVDAKDEIGRITFKMDNEYVRSKKTTEAQIKDIDAFIKLCKENDIYVIARISSFFDKYITKLNKDLAIKTKSGKYYEDNNGWYWLNPYNEEVKKYLIEVGKGCAKAGFDEVQYDYFRFSADAGMRNVVFSEEETKGRTKIEVISEIAQDIYKELAKENIYVSIDVFGAIMNSYKDQAAIGQEYQTLLKNTDYLCPMVYPSHYANNTFNLSVPDLEPYNAVKGALDTSKQVVEKTYESASHYGKIRPWLQGFTANYLPEFLSYGPNEYKEQIKAVEDAGYEEWLMWHPGGVYKWDAFKIDE